jgi:Flp pilus assembly protein TadD
MKAQRRRLRIIGVCAGAAIALGTIGAQAERRNVVCNLSAKPTDDLIRNCTDLIASGRDIGRPLADSYIARGRGYIAKSQYEAAVTDFDQAVRNAPGYVLALRSRANGYLLRADYDRAIKDYTEAIWLAPKDASLFQERAQAYEGKGEYRLASLDYADVMRIAPKYVPAYRDRCYMRMIWGRELPQALADCSDALKLAPNDPLTLERRGLVYLRLDLYDKALADFEAILKLNALQPTALYGRGLIKRKRGDEPGGDADINAARLMRPDIVEIYTRYGIK